MAESSVKSPAELAKDSAPGNSGSNLDIDIGFDKQGALEQVKVDGQLVPLERAPEQATQSGDATQVSSYTERLSESVQRLWEASIDVWDNFLEYVPYLLLALAVFVAVIFLASAVKNAAVKLIQRTGMRYSLSEVLARFIYVAVWIAGALVIAKLLFPGFEFGTALTYLGVASLVAGFAFRDIFENAFAGLLILWRFPFEMGDYIEVETDPPVRGRVHDIWVRSTLIREVTDELVVVPNAKIYQNAVRVTTWRQNDRQTFATLVSYDTDLEHAKEVIRSTVQACERVEETPATLVYVTRFADSGVELEVAWWAQSGPLEELQSRDQVALAIRKALDRENIEIPFPYRTLTFKPEHPLHATSHTGDDGKRA